VETTRTWHDPISSDAVPKTAEHKHKDEVYKPNILGTKRQKRGRQTCHLGAQDKGT